MCDLDPVSSYDCVYEDDVSVLFIICLKIVLRCQLDPCVVPGIRKKTISVPDCSIFCHYSDMAR